MPAQKTESKSPLKTEKPVVQSDQPLRPEPLKVLLEWQALGRPFKKRSREYFTTIGAIVFLLIVILLALQEWLLIIVAVALTFYAYVTATIEPDKTTHQITNRGVSTGGRNYFWGQLGRFWFTEKWDQKMVQIENFEGLPGRLILLLGEISEEKVKKLLAERLLHEEPEKTWVDNASDWLSRRVPLESS